MSSFKSSPFFWGLPLPAAAMTVISCGKYGADPDDSEEDADLQILRGGSSLMDDEDMTEYNDDGNDDEVQEEEARQDYFDDFRCDNDREQEDELRDTGGGERMRWSSSRPPMIPRPFRSSNMVDLQLPTLDTFIR
jgi:hypothetical protein